MSVIQLIMVWAALRLGRIGFKDLRCWFALWEMRSRRCLLEEGQTPEFSSEELQGLIGGPGGEAIRECLRCLKTAGLIKTLSKESIELSASLEDLASDPELVEAIEESLALIPNHDRLVPLPRRLVRLIAGGARRTLVATLLGHAIRCLWYRKGMVHPSGAVKASWIAEVFGVSERRVHEQRQHLIELGILEALETPQRVLNRLGQWVAFNLDWTPLPKAPIASEPKSDAARAGELVPPDLSPPRAENTPPIVTPIKKQETLPSEELETRKPGSAGPGTGFYKQDSDGKISEPTLRDIRPEDLRDPARLMTLHGQAIAQGFISDSEADRLNFFAAANHSRVIGSINPPGLFAWMVRTRSFKFATQDDEDAARVQIRRALYPTLSPDGSPRGGPLSGFNEGPPKRPTLSDDARFVQDITQVLKAKGVAKSSTWRLVNRERPEWTRERWDAASAELNGGPAPVGGGLVGSFSR